MTDVHSYVKGMLDAGTTIEVYCRGDPEVGRENVQEIYNSLNDKSKEAADGQLRLGIPVLLKSLDKVLGFDTSRLIGDVDKFFNGLTGLDLVKRLLKLGDALLDFYPGPAVDISSYNQGIESMDKVLKAATSGYAEILNNLNKADFEIFGTFGSLIKKISPFIKKAVSSLTGYDVDELGRILGYLDEAKALAFGLKIDVPEVTGEAQKIKTS